MFHGGTRVGPKGKFKIPAKTIYCFFLIFPFVPPMKQWKKSYLNELKFWEAQKIINQEYAEKFSFLFHVGPRNLPRSPYLWPRWSGPLVLGIRERMRWALVTNLIFMILSCRIFGMSRPEEFTLLFFQEKFTYLIGWCRISRLTKAAFLW